ncbi:hypothetical protein ALC53_00808 [Atta colombica]|uniref:RNA polymerase II elongation factor ELL N-terminal domain-containing protein n=1 Tax=Atta colombica TaxID=520822 RepID=A0A195BWK4_9HYME|nr:hypothetical protein ALC53_00808 [Atta colombica]
MGDEEMALVPDVQYGLSSHGNFDERKSLIFVKLTDSSQRAIKEYLKIKRILLVCTVPGLRPGSQCLRSLRFKVDRCACAHACTRTYTRMDVLSSCTDRTYTWGGRMNSLEFAAREKVNQLAVLANFSSWRSEQAHDVCLPACLPVANRQPCLVARRLCPRQAIN